MDEPWFPMVQSRKSVRAGRFGALGIVASNAHMPKDTPKPGGIFPETRWSAIVAARSSDQNQRHIAFDRITRAYWKPIYKYIRAKWNKSRHDAEDLTQEFFARVIDKNFLVSYDPAKARLRTFLRTCVDALVQNQHRSAGAQKRGGSAPTLSLDFELAEGELKRTGLPAPERIEDFFEKEWVRSIFEMAVDRLRSECKTSGRIVHFRLFERYDLNADEQDTSYAELALEFNIAQTDVTNYLSYARREFRRITLDLLREMTSSEQEFRHEARALMR
jgi:RNA polymerase sigma factor (sigma-70 family)